MTRHIRRDAPDENASGEPVGDPAHDRQQPGGTPPPSTGTQRQPGVDEERAEERPLSGHEAAHEKFGGMNFGAVFFGWLVAVGVTILLAGIITAVATAVDEGSDLSVSLNQDASTIGLTAGIALLVVLFLGYYCGGYVAGRMSRFDGARQGVGVWVLGLLVTVAAVVLGAVFGDKYNVLDRVDLPRIPFSDQELTIGGVIAGLAVLVATLVAAILGGIVGHRYHNRVDRVVRD